jgi:putative transposase
MSFWRLFYHLVWTTMKRQTMIDPQVEGLLVRSLQANCAEKEIVVHALGVMPDHVHAALSIPPRHSVSNVAHDLKGKSSRQINDAFFRARRETFAWQPEFGVVSFGERSLDRVVAYINNQETHHADNTIWPLFETIDRRVAAYQTVEDNIGGVQT